MGTSLPVLACSLLALVLVVSSHGRARADAISPAPPCEAGMARGGREVMGGMGAWAGHGGAPPCEPAVCEDASTCGPRQVCRRDAHCIAARETLVPTAHGHSASPPELRMVDFDLGLCEDDGTCPEGSHCLELATCRARGAPDTGMAASVFGSRGGTRAAGGWSFATPREGAATPDPEAVIEPAAPEATVPEAAVPEETVPTEPATATSTPPTSPPATCSCGVAQRSPTALLLGFGCMLAVRCRQRPSRTTTRDAATFNAIDAAARRPCRARSASFGAMLSKMALSSATKTMMTS